MKHRYDYFGTWSLGDKRVGVGAQNTVVFSRSMQLTLRAQQLNEPQDIIVPTSSRDYSTVHSETIKPFYGQKPLVGILQSSIYFWE